MAEVTLSVPASLAALGERWQALEAEAAPSFFQSWTWVGCLAEARFPDPVLLEVRTQGRTVALALFNRRAGWPSDRLWLGESGRPDIDLIFTEYNDPLIASGQTALLPTLLAAALSSPLPGRRRGRRLTLGGVSAAVRAAAGGVADSICVPAAIRPAPRVDLAALRQTENPAAYLDSLSANARYQIRRSARRYAALGALRIERAQDLDTAHLYLGALAVLHQATWSGRGRPGAFATPAFVRFHRELLRRAWPAGAIDLLRISAGAHVVGYLYNFRFRNHAYAYQSGFDYAVSHPHQKPGLTCHHLAIERAAADRLDVYDFLAGADRYKTSMANAETELHWFDLVRRHSPHGVLAQVRQLARRVRGGG